MKEREVTGETNGSERADIVANFIQDHHPPPETINHFHSIPWTREWLTNPDYTPMPFWSRHAKAVNSEDYFFARTINTDSTIPHLLVLRHRSATTPEIDAVPSPSTSSSSPPSHPDLAVLIQLGPQGLDGHPALIHGGVTCALLDELQSEVVTMHRRMIGGAALADALFTANLNVDYRAPVPTPAPVLLKAWLVSRHRRKWVTKACIEDHSGKVLARGEALWVVKTRVRI